MLHQLLIIQQFIQGWTVDQSYVYYIDEGTFLYSSSLVFMRNLAISLTVYIYSEEYNETDLLINIFF
jgi:hypothetical protein